MNIPDKIIKIYYVIVASVSIIVLWINIALALWAWLKQYIISDEEYIANNNYKIQNCEQPIKTNEWIQENARTEEEIQDCKENARTEILS